MALSMFLIIGVVVLLLYVSVFVVLPLSLAAITQLRWWNHHHRRRHSHENNDGTSDDDDDDSTRHCLCLGRVWHTRFLPKIHAFSYPIFMFAIDLSSSSSFASSSDSPGNTSGVSGGSASSDDDNDFNDLMWPLSYLVTFRAQIDHLKNGEGLNEDVQQTARSKDGSDVRRAASVAAAASAAAAPPSLQQRVFNLVSERTDHKFVPTPATHRVVLLTHLCYYGYNFNPVSFYYVIRKKNGSNGSDDDVNDLQPLVVEAMVGEVSNTPWNEMYCYVLHPESKDNVQVTNVDDDDDNKKKNNDATATTTEINYVFRKSFHVSPFMEMDYLYDWSFVAARGEIASYDKNNKGSGSTTTTTTTGNSSNYSVAPLPNNSITVLNSLKRPRKQQQQQQTLRQTSGGTDSSNSNSTNNETNSNTEFDLAFRAKLELDCYPATSPIRVAYQIIRFPIYCFIIQVWIHWEAVWLLVKGVVYVPHPDESETTVSKIIATIMIPFFAIRDMTNPQSQTATAKTTTTTTNEKKES
eukprot:CAMPEP_0113468134 /NCGR_PEP_ID=MMETSP0014_2-20120614/15192_1 /TAXON_ID=2857 /ORGANISM="Nitzschia sp." /LENGTH=522 /DNA_ID=CAMNT_0000360501 /DNA_START=48 /DNA_END=1616 /DNA_ORIENTATION=+ /assembly_acc=CAM_ASM_000159